MSLHDSKTSGRIKCIRTYTAFNQKNLRTQCPTKLIWSLLSFRVVNERQSYLKCLVDIFCESNVTNIQQELEEVYSNEMRRFIFIVIF